MIAAPAVSVTSVRVSDTVSTKTRTDTGAAALCSSLLTARLYEVPKVPAVPKVPRVLRYGRMPRVIAALILMALTLNAQAQQTLLDKAARQWVDATLKKMTLEQIAGQMIFAPFNSTYLSSDTDEYDKLVKLVHETHIGGVIAFGGNEAIPQVMLNNTYGAVVLGQPLELASILNRLQAISALPLLTSSDFEWGVQMRVAGATKFPRAMAFGAAGDPQLAYEAGKVIGAESRAIGVHVDFAPVADVNNNPRNPVINIRSFGEDPTRAGVMVSNFARGLQDAGMLATL